MPWNTAGLPLASGRALSPSEFRYLNPRAGHTSSYQSDTSGQAYQDYLNQFNAQQAAGGAAPGGSGGFGQPPLPGSYNPAFGGIPSTTPPTQSFQNLLGGIEGNIPGAQNVIGGLTSASADALRRQYSPGYFGALDTVTGNIGRRAQGDISDLLPERQQAAAEWGIGRGVSGSALENSKLLRDLGLTRYAVEEQAAKDLNEARAATPVVQPFDLSRLVPDIGQQINAQQLADMLRSAPIPAAAAQNLLNQAVGGLQRGYGGAGGYGSGGYGGSYSGNVGSSSGSASVPSNVVQTYGPRAGITQSPTPAAPKGPGWGEAYNNQGGYSSTGTVPPADPWGWAQREREDQDFSDVLAALEEDPFGWGKSPETGGPAASQPQPPPGYSSWDEYIQANRSPEYQMATGDYGPGTYLEY